MLTEKELLQRILLISLLIPTSFKSLFLRLRQIFVIALIEPHHSTQIAAIDSGYNSDPSFFIYRLLKFERLNLARKLYLAQLLKLVNI